MKRAEPPNAAETIPEGYKVFAHVACDSASDIIAYLRKGGVRVVGNTRPRYVARLSRYWRWQQVPESWTTPVAVPVEDVELANRLWQEWQRKEDARIRPLLARIHRGAILAVLAIAALWAVLWFVLKSIELATSLTVVVVVAIMLLRNLRHGTPTGTGGPKKRRRRY